MPDPAAQDADAQWDALLSAPQEAEQRRASIVAAVPGAPAVAAGAKRLGIVTAGSLSEGLSVKLDRDVSVEQLAVGSYVVARGRHGRFFCMVTDILLDNANPLLAKLPPDVDDPFLAQVHQGATIFGALQLTPLLLLDESGQVKPVKTVPEHFTAIYGASQSEVNQVFGEEGLRSANGRETHFFHVGAPLDMASVKIALSLERLVERSSGVFGKSGTGKTFLGRLLLAGIIQNNVAVNLIFDMHNEYGWEAAAEHTSTVKGLKQLFPGQVSIFTLDEESSRRRGIHPDFVVSIGYDKIDPEDLELLAGTLGLSEVQVGAAYALRRRLREKWLSIFLDDRQVDEWQSEDPETGKLTTGLKALADSVGQTFGTLAALRRRFEQMRNYGFLVPTALDDSVGRIMSYLDKGVSVVLEFGRYGSNLDAYILVANFLTRRIHQRYVEKKERALGLRRDDQQTLLITIEEAHKFLDPAVANNTIFGVIAREMRKYNVTLFIVDQRPSGIDAEVMSQIGTRVTLLLDNPADIQAVLSGVNGAAGLREVLARLDTHEQALILGHAVPMPVVVQTRRYDTDFYRSMGDLTGAELAQQLQSHTQLMRGAGSFQGFD